MSRRSSRTIYVGNLPGDIRLREVEDLFYKVRMRISGLPTSQHMGYHRDNFFYATLDIFLGFWSYR